MQKAVPIAVASDIWTAGVEGKVHLEAKRPVHWDDPVEVLRVSVSHIEIAPSMTVHLKKLAGIEKLPLTKADLQIELKGIPTAYANALRRVMTDEMKNHALTVGKPLGASGTTDPFMFDHFVRDRIMQIPLRPQISKDVIAGVSLRVHVTNNTTSDMKVYSGDMVVVKGKLTEPIFNPTIEIAFLQPGRMICVEDIHITEGYGRDFGGYQMSCLGNLRHLDLKEVPQEQTHLPGGSHVDQSGYELSSMVADPRHHEISVVIPAIGVNPAEATSIAVDACINIKERLRLIQMALETDSPDSATAGQRSWGTGDIQFTLIDLDDGKSQGVLRIAGETHTIGNMLARTIFEQTPAISYVGYSCIKHNNAVHLTVKHMSDVPGIVLRAVKHAQVVMSSIQKGISGQRIEPAIYRDARRKNRRPAAR